MPSLCRREAVRGIALVLLAGALLGGAAPVPSADAQAAPEAVPGSKRTIQTFESWTLTCDEDAADHKTCTMVQRLADRRSGRPVVAWTIGVDGERRLVSSLRTPTLADLAAGVSLTVDALEPRRLAYRTCAPAFCEVLLPLDETLVRELKAGSTATLAFTPLGNQVLKLPFSLKGFTRALQALAEETAG